MQRIPSPGFRVSSGPLKIGNDWCGYFFRGDEIPVDHLSIWKSFISNPDTDWEGTEGTGITLRDAVCKRIQVLIDQLNECQE